MFYGNFYLQGARAMSAFHTGLMFLPGAVGVIIGAPLGARLVRRYGVGPIAGSALAVVALTFMTSLLYTVDTPLVWFGIVGAIGGIAIGATVAPTTAAVIGTLPMERIGAGSAVNNTVRQVGSVLGIAVLGTIMSSAYRHGIGPALTGLPDQSQAAARPSAEATRHVATVIGRTDLIGTANRAFVHAMHVTAAWAAVVAGIGAIALVAAFRAWVSAPRLPAQPPAGALASAAATRATQEEAQPAAAQPV
jgi:MFS family permease